MAAALGAMVLGACGGSARDITAVPVAQPTLGPVRVSAQWLRQQPGPRLGEFGFHLLDADGRALSDWSRAGLQVSVGSDAGEYVVEAAARPSDDIYLYVTYPGADVHVDDARLAAGRSGDYVLLAIPGRIRDVLVIGMARIGGRRTSALEPGPLARISFAAGGEQVTRAASRVNEDPRSAAVFGASGGGDAMNADIWWEERNIGDYNNNGLVEVADLTPVGIYFDQEVAAADDPELLEIVDGTLDGFVTIHDITPIGQNFDSRIDGFRLYVAFVPDPEGDDFKLHPYENYAAWPRSAVFDAADELARRKRLQYRGDMIPVDDPSGVWQGGKISFMVRAFTDDGGTIEEGPPSNAVELTYGGFPPNLQPEWLDPASAAGMTDAWGDAAGGWPGVWVEFGGALDYDNDELFYRIYYTEDGEDLYGPNGALVEIPEGDLAGDPPWRYFLPEIYRTDETVDLFQRGVNYRFYVTVTDKSDWHPELGGDGPLIARPPGLRDSPDSWSHYRGDAQRTGSNPDCTLSDPIAVAHGAALSGGAPADFGHTLISADGWGLGPDMDGLPQRVDLTDGSAQDLGTIQTGSEFYAALSGERLLYSDGDSLLSLRYDGSDERSRAVNCGTAPLVLGDLVYIVSEGGDAYCYTADRLIEQWKRELELTQLPDTVLAPAADDTHLYFAVDQTLYKLDLLTGAEDGLAILPYPPAGRALALDKASEDLYICVESGAASDNTMLLRYSTSSMEETHRFPAAAGSLPTASPCLALQHDPPVVLVGSGATLTQYDLETGTGRWQVQLSGHIPREITCTSDRVFVITTASHLMALEMNGRRRQLTPLNNVAMELALGEERGLTVGDAEIQVLETQDPDPPPIYPGAEEGIQQVTAGDGEITAQWAPAEDEHGEVVSYAVFYSDEWPVEFDEPRTHTTVIPNIDAGVSSLSVQWLENGTRYWVGVRAYDGVWGVDANVEQNTNVMGATPPWQREQVRLGSELPEGEVLFMRGLVEPPGDDGWLVYSDAAAGQLITIENFGFDGDYQWIEVRDGSDDPVYAQGFDLGWGSEPDKWLIAIANTAALGRVGLLRRNWDLSYNMTVFPDTDPVVNPQVALGSGAETALAYTEDIFDVAVESHVDYYLKRTAAGVWQDVEPFEETNLSGRDLDLVLSPLDNASPWIALQRGGESTPNRYTPQEGELMYARWETDSWAYETVDSGDNAPDSDCGKRVVQVLDDSGHPHLAYLDLNADPDDPSGQLKYAWHDGGAWQIETIETFPLDFNYLSDQFIWSELGLALYEPEGGGQQPLIAQLHRTTARTLSLPQRAILEVWAREGPDSWRREQLTDEEWIFTEDRAPCVLLVPSDGVWHVFYATTHDQQVVDGADALVHYWRPVS